MKYLLLALMLVGCSKDYPIKCRNMQVFEVSDRLSKDFIGYRSDVLCEDRYIEKVHVGKIHGLGIMLNIYCNGSSMYAECYGEEVKEEKNETN